MLNTFTHVLTSLTFIRPKFLNNKSLKSSFLIKIASKVADFENLFVGTVEESINNLVHKYNTAIQPNR